jgi:hypothetical protein
MRHMFTSQAMQTVAGGIILVCATAGLAHGQAFTNLKNSLVDYSQTDVEPRIACERLAAAFKAKELVDLKATAMPATADVPAHCRVSGLLRPEIGFEVNLPARWNRRFYMIGNGGHAGEGPDDPGRAAQRADALRNGFVMASTNTGHDARKEPQATFVLSNPQKAVDYAYRAVHLTATTAKDIAEKYYSKDVSRSYWNSCSNGGRQGLIEAQRYPRISTASSPTRHGRIRPASRSARCGISARWPTRRSRRRSSRSSRRV